MDARGRTGLATSAADFLPARGRSLTALRAAARTCRGCPLWKRGTQTVFGEGRAGARLLLVGEQPGNDEDLSGRPFVGPAGRLLDAALQQAGIAREDAYVTNAVKHFKWVPKGKRRLHAKPDAREVAACSPWLTAEIAAVRPQLLVCLGATASQALLGRAFRLTKERGRFVESDLAPFVAATVHPSAILRSRTDAERHAAMAAFVADLKRAARALNFPAGDSRPGRLR